MRLKAQVPAKVIKAVIQESKNLYFTSGVTGSPFLKIGKGKVKVGALQISGN